MSSLMERRRALMAAEKKLVPNFIEIGTPNIVSGILYPTSNGGIRVPEMFPPADAETWEIYCEFIYSSKISTGYQTLFSGSASPTRLSAAKYGIYLDSSYARGRIIDSSGTTIINLGTIIGVSQNSNTKIAKLSYDGSVYRFAINGTIKGGTSENGVDPQYLLIGYPEPFGGSINLKTFKIYKNGSIWWTPYK